MTCDLAILCGREVAKQIGYTFDFALLQAPSAVNFTLIKPQVSDFPTRAKEVET